MFARPAERSPAIFIWRKFPGLTMYRQQRTRSGRGGVGFGAYALDSDERYRFAGIQANVMVPLQQRIQQQQQKIDRRYQASDLEANATATAKGCMATIYVKIDAPKTGYIRNGCLPVMTPGNGDVAMLKRQIYRYNRKWLPACQTLINEAGQKMLETNNDGSPMQLADYNVRNESRITVKLVEPDEVLNSSRSNEELDEARQSNEDPAYASASRTARPRRRQTRWTDEETEALVEGLEEYGLGAWKDIVNDPRLAKKDNVQCKDKFRSLRTTIIHNKDERLLYPEQLKARIRAILDQEDIQEPDEVPDSSTSDEDPAYASASGAARTHRRNTRWTDEETEALVEGLEEYGLGAWRHIVNDPRLAKRDNGQCKDKFRNICTTIIHNKDERLLYTEQLKTRLRAILDQEDIQCQQQGEADEPLRSDMAAAAEEEPVDRNGQAAASGSTGTDRGGAAGRRKRTKPQAGRSSKKGKRGTGSKQGRSQGR